jgi:hypothetical protein
MNHWYIAFHGESLHQLAENGDSGHSTDTTAVLEEISIGPVRFALNSLSYQVTTACAFFCQDCSYLSRLGVTKEGYFEDNREEGELSTNLYLLA